MKSQNIEKRFNPEYKAVDVIGRYSHELKKIIDYNETHEDYLEKNSKLYNHCIENDDFDTHYSIYKGRYDLSYNLEIGFPNIFRFSLFSYTYSMFEKFMNVLCFYYEEKLNLKIKLLDLNDKGIIRARKYLEKTVNLDLSSIQSEWEMIKKYQEIRNQLTHNLDELEFHKNESNIWKDIKNKVKGIEFPPYTNFYVIRLTKDFNIEFINILNKFFDKLHLVVNSI